MAGENVLDCRGLRRRFGEIVAVDGGRVRLDAGETARGDALHDKRSRPAALLRLASRCRRQAGDLLLMLAAVE